MSLLREEVCRMITVVGSINIDLVVKTDEIPKIGETLLGNEFLQIPGGKGANQGVTIAKLKEEITFLGKVGNDNYGDILLTSMRDAGVNIEHIEKVEGGTGIAVINVDKEGRNNITVIPGANKAVDQDYIMRNKEAIEKAELVLFQLEIPIETVRSGLKLAKELGKVTVLNPAPAQELDDEMIKNIDILIPNEYELERISKVKVSTEESILTASKVLLDKGVEKLIVTLGSQGVLYIDHKGHEFYKAYKVNAVDTTGAGDSFIGGFVASYVKDGNIEAAIEIGQKVAALSVQKVGAQSSFPTLKEVENFKA